MMKIAAPTGFGDAFPPPIGHLQPGGWGKGLGGSLTDEGTTMWNSDRERGASATAETGDKMKTTRRIRYEERRGRRRMVGGGVTGGDKSISRGEATMTRRRRYNETTTTTMNVTTIGATSASRQ